MTTMHVTNDFNVEASLNGALTTALAAITPTAWLAAPAVVYDWPEIEHSTPCFSIIHFTNALSDNYQGRGDGAGNSTVRASGLMEVSAWVSRDQKYNNQDIWVARIREMEAMISSVYIANPVILIKDYLTSQSAPALTGYKVNLANLEFVQTADDPNPAIRRRKALISYFWDLRA